LLNHKQPIDVVFTLDENEWNGNKHLQLKVIDFRLSPLDLSLVDYVRIILLFFLPASGPRFL
jgi:hypothetical protein